MTNGEATYEAVFDMGTARYTRALDFETFKSLVHGMAKPGETYVISKLTFPPGIGDPEREFVIRKTKD